MVARLKAEAECCATVSIIYASPLTALHVTEPKYTLQDVVIIISGSIEAWIGISAVHAYLFFERIYASLMKAKLIQQTWTSTST